MINLVIGFRVVLGQEAVDIVEDMLGVDAIIRACGRR
jgi:hypothetical protein